MPYGFYPSANFFAVEDIGVDVVKTGCFITRNVIEIGGGRCVSIAVRRAAVVADPVMVAMGGEALAQPDAGAALL